MEVCEPEQDRVLQRTNVKDAMAAAKAAKSAPEFAPESETRGRNFSSVSACLTIPK